MSTQDEALQQVEDVCAKIVDFLTESKVPGPTLDPICKLADDHAAEEVLERAEELGAPRIL